MWVDLFKKALLPENKTLFIFYTFSLNISKWVHFLGGIGEPIMQINEYYLKNKCVWKTWESHCYLAKALLTDSWNTELNSEGKEDNHSKCILKMKGSSISQWGGSQQGSRQVTRCACLGSWDTPPCQPSLCPSEPAALVFLELLLSDVCGFMFLVEL